MTNPAPGWYQNQQGYLQWWDGQRWGGLAQVAPARTDIAGKKQTSTAYLFAILLGGFAAHRFYLGKIASAFIFLVLWWGGWIIMGASHAIYVNGGNNGITGGIGILATLTGVIWWIFDVCTLAGQVTSYNKAHAQRI